MVEIPTPDSSPVKEASESASVSKTVYPFHNSCAFDSPSRDGVSISGALNPATPSAATGLRRCGNRGSTGIIGHNAETTASPSQRISSQSESEQSELPCLLSGAASTSSVRSNGGGPPPLPVTSHVDTVVQNHDEDDTPPPCLEAELPVATRTPVTVKEEPHMPRPPSLVALEAAPPVAGVVSVTSAPRFHSTSSSSSSTPTGSDLTVGGCNNYTSMASASASTASASNDVTPLGSVEASDGGNLDRSNSMVCGADTVTSSTVKNEKQGLSSATQVVTLKNGSAKREFHNYVLSALVWKCPKIGKFATSNLVKSRDKLCFRQQNQKRTNVADHGNSA